ncbi:hypothetical protein AAG570_002383 [Ranatra chinensis]|uniref:Uncharacterized protein n=1 Tax=Ranatra chinensis TaxID=642074 RepID=A0ABD0YJN1_9HEMI
MASKRRNMFYKNTKQETMEIVLIVCIEQLLREKARGDDDFLELCKLRQGAAKHTLHYLVQLPRASNNWITSELVIEIFARGSQFVGSSSRATVPIDRSVIEARQWSIYRLGRRKFPLIREPVGTAG